MEKLVIIGTGPAGYTAAIYAARAELKPLVIAGSVPGGLLTQTTDIENFPGFPEALQGFELMERMRQQAERFGARVQQGLVSKVAFKPGGPHTLTLDDGSALEAMAVIIATGSRPRELGLPEEAALRNHGISYCATCDGAFFRKVPVVVVGGGDSALEEALFLTHFASEVHVIHRRDALRASVIMQKRVLEHPKITLQWNSVVAAVSDPQAEKVTAVTLKDTVSGTTRELPCAAVFVAIGHLPSTEVFADALSLNNGYIVLPDAGQSSTTAVEGVFAAGDCVDAHYRQAITAAGMGCRAAIDAERWLSLRLEAEK